ncbi:MAG: beta-N-acetylhexosaminidase [Bacteroidia bacterium]
MLKIAGTVFASTLINARLPKMVIRFFITFILLLISVKSFAPPLVTNPNTWVEATYEAMTEDERIAQLLMIEVRPTYGKAHLDAVESTIRNYNVGGLIFFKGDPLTQVQLTNSYQAMSKHPLLIAIDGEWGLAMRLSNTTSFPYQMGLGGIQDNELIYKMGRQIGRQCKRMGIHVNFAPVIDVNNNPNNPVINYRSFGEDRKNVAEKGWAYAKGMQDENIMACAKHFPGHGDTDVDSHKDLPVILHNRARLDSVELYPFKVLIDSGVMSIMTAHLYIPAIDPTPNQAISISEKGINGLLRTELKFNGLAFTDALNMQGVAKYHEPGALELKALKAGNDILLAPGNVPKAIELIKKAIVSGEISKKYVADKVKKVLVYKHWVGLDEFHPIAEENLLAELNSSYATFLLNTLIEKQLCVVRDDKNWLPLPVNSVKKMAVVALGSSSETDFQRTIKRYHTTTNFNYGTNLSSGSIPAIAATLKKFDYVVVGLHNTSRYPKNNYGVSYAQALLINTLNKEGKCVLVDFGNPYNLKNFGKLNAVVMAYQDDKVNQVKAAQMLFGAVPANAFLPVGVTNDFLLRDRAIIPDLRILGYAEPEETGMNSEKLSKIDEIAQNAIDKGATPGCQVLVARHGKVVYQKSFGEHIYGGVKVKDDDLYDLASLTKVGATTLAVMKLVEDSLLSLNDPLSKFLPGLDTTNKKEITVLEVLTHSAGLKDWIPFYSVTLNPEIYDTTYSRTESEKFCIKVSDDLYMCKDYQKVIIGTIYDSEVKSPGNYKYSDLGMILMRYVIENITNTSFDKYVDSVFYKPMGLRSMTFNPLQKFSKNQIVPTEDNADFRGELIHGYVHDPAAAMLDGISGHAGLFASSADVAAVMQMLLNGGFYNGTRFLNPETIAAFTSYQSTNSRRGVGFDKVEPNSNKINPYSDYGSARAFGHTGFTGTMMWADPDKDFIYIFLSNRIYPSSSNKLLVSMGVRTDILDVIYKSIEE